MVGRPEAGQTAPCHLSSFCQEAAQPSKVRTSEYNQRARHHNRSNIRPFLYKGWSQTNFGSDIHQWGRHIVGIPALNCGSATFIRTTIKVRALLLNVAAFSHNLRTLIVSLLKCQWIKIQKNVLLFLTKFEPESCGVRADAVTISSRH